MGVSTMTNSSYSNGERLSSQLATVAVHAGTPIDQVSGAVIEPVSQGNPRQQSELIKIDLPINDFRVRGGRSTDWLHIHSKRKP